MDISNAFTALLDSIKNNNGFEDNVFDEFISRSEDEYKKCEDKLSKKFVSLLVNNEFLHDSEIIGLSVKSYFSNQKYLCDVDIQIKTSQKKKLHTITYKQVSPFIIERYEESNSRWTWGYGYIKKMEDNHIEQNIICFPCTLIKMKCKKIIIS
ncbi:hypothetical protein CLHUN_14550 [Ruminiclostridium hungatei]|uniref:Uncharacterized protein n=1 Tax=Ruminiclostridium hungatei TaxID=48256 RepID=A0A1V4SKP5_RUMHU|nr:hypothetical protein [Ruminiclostridium hungatei]OPX44462.1 hypothetical protein CLHUN_14550 [Ruminiclostridium hungatei]